MQLINLKVNSCGMGGFNYANYKINKGNSVTNMQAI